MTYDRLWVHLVSQETNGSLIEFAQKKFEVFRRFFKTISDVKLIQITNLSMPKEIQSSLMSKLFTSFDPYVKFLEKKQAEMNQNDTNQEDVEGHEQDIQDIGPSSSNPSDETVQE